MTKMMMMKMMKKINFLNPLILQTLFYRDDNIKKNILTYKFAPRGGIGAVVQGTSIGIDERQDSIVIIYGAEPLEGFTIEPGPFSDKVVIQDAHHPRGVDTAHCFMRWSN